MLFAYLDASVLVKRYAPEPGSLVVDHLFSRVPLDRMAVLSVGLAEVISILVRKHNGGVITTATFQQALLSFYNEMGTPSAVQAINVDRVLAESAYPFIERYSVNSTDAILLRSALDWSAALRAAGDDLLLVTSDRRLLRAAQLEGLTVFNPEAQAITDLDGILGP